MFVKEVLIDIRSEKVALVGTLTIPSGARGLVLFAHGSGSSRMSPRNRYVAEVINKAGVGTLLFDLLTVDEEAVDIYTREYRFDIGLLARRLLGATEWVTQNPETAKLNLGYFGSSTGAAAALIAAAKTSQNIGAVVSRGGRPDLAEGYLQRVKAPTLFIVGGLDDVVIELNEGAYQDLKCEKEFTIIEGATHLFEEPGKLEEVARIAAGWFVTHLSSGKIQ